MEQIKGKKILVVGATGGIGSQVVKLLKNSGADLYLTGRDEEKLMRVASNNQIDPSAFFATDLTHSDSIQLLKEKFFSKYEHIDVLINASGIGVIKNTEALSAEAFIQTVQINLIAPFMILKEFLPSMKEAKKGLIIHIPGVLGKTPMAGAAAYSASKYGLMGMLQSIREEIKRTDIRITNLVLGGVDSPFWDHIDLRVQKDKMIQAEEAAKAIWFLCQQPTSGVINEMVLQPFNHQAV